MKKLKRYEDRLWAAAVIYELLVVIPSAIVYGPVIAALFFEDALGAGSWSWLGGVIVFLVGTGLFGMQLLLVMGFIDYARRD